MEKVDILIKGAVVYPLNRKLDIGIVGNKIAVLQNEISKESAGQVIDADGCVVSPGFVDSHMHIDKSLTANEDDTTDLLSAHIRSLKENARVYSGWSKDAIVDEIVERTSKVVEKCIVNGTTAIKTHVLITDDWDMCALDALEILKRKYQHSISIYNIVPCIPAYEREWRMYAEQGKIDFIGAYPNCTTNLFTGLPEYDCNYVPAVDFAFQLAKEYHLPLDIHCDESDSNDISCFRYIIEKTAESNMAGFVTCGHVTGLGARGIDEDDVYDAIANCSKYGVSVTSLTSCNMYLMESGRRGPTRVEQLMDAGVNVSIASDNIRDPFRPFGNGDLLEEALLTAQVHKFGTREKLCKLFRMITYNPAKNTLLDNYGVMPGCTADLVIMKAPDISEAILSKAKRAYVLKAGKIVAKDGKML